MPGQRGITLRVRKPNQTTDDQPPLGPGGDTSTALRDDPHPTSSSSLSSIDAGAVTAEQQRSHDSDADANGDVSMSAEAEVGAEADTAGSSSQPAPAAPARSRRARVSRARSTEIKAEIQANVQASPRSRRRRRQSSMQAPKEELGEEDGERADEAGSVKGGPSQQAPINGLADATGGEAGERSDEDDGRADEGDDKPRIEGSQRPSRATARSKSRSEAARAGAKARASVGRAGRWRAAGPSRSRARSRQAVASDDDGGDEGDASVAEAQSKDAEPAEDGTAGEGEGEGEGDGNEDNANDSANDDDDDDGDEGAGTGVDADGFKTITIKGKVYRLEGDEVILDSDPDGDKKVDEKGRLQGGRQYKAYNFTSDLRDDPERVYMLSIDAARAASYRDSLYFFRKNPMIIKITLKQGEKDKLIEDGRLSGQLKSRNVTMVAARNVYKLHGARFISGGKAVIDDYYEAAARASGVKEGKTVGGMSVEEQERKKEADRERDRSRRRPDAFSYATYDPQGEVVTTVFGDAGQSPFVRAGNWVSRRALLQRSDVTEENWMLEMARSVRGMNSELAETRRERLVAFRHFDDGLHASAAAAAVVDEPLDGEADPEDDEEAANDRPPWERDSLADAEDKARKRKAKAAQRQGAKKQRGPPIGIFEPSTHMPHFGLSTQPTWARLDKVGARPHFVRDEAQEAGSVWPVLGGDRVGSGAWGVASFTTEVLPPPPPSPTVRVAGGVDAGGGRDL
ncbi:uncharacterized protein PFL1_00818 [Pseudozyma flocculosa PF-1]|uniref:uncharacterized protein n=1 Tax=Pseudozyma flocculosa PF-1 TaxID=1277687 RepID=UPI0004560BD3|nr:uncharacterized protein PFL1_00818 [Pseudozyma flocculosa PF-1]EPQ31483.1 hypothetical protein PFL1_00818 [Pseudozyma flocculosa PF-1]